MTRIIVKLDVKPPYVVKPIHFEGLRKIGLPKILAKNYYKKGADELIYIDIVSSLYKRKILYDEFENTSAEIFIPMTYGGGVKSTNDFSKLIHSGADKVAINTHAIQENSNIINNASKIFGSQSVVVNIEAKRWDNYYECYTDCGRIRSGKNVINWAREVESRGAGEIFLQCVDTDGRQRGFDIELSKQIVDSVNIPVIVGSGAGNLDHIKKLVDIANPSGVVISSLLHYGKHTIRDIKNSLKIKI